MGPVQRFAAAAERRLQPPEQSAAASTYHRVTAVGAAILLPHMNTQQIIPLLSSSITCICHICFILLMLMFFSPHTRDPFCWHETVWCTAFSVNKSGICRAKTGSASPT